MTFGVKTSDDISDFFGSTLLSGLFDAAEVLPFTPSQQHTMQQYYTEFARDLQSPAIK